MKKPSEEAQLIDRDAALRYVQGDEEFLDELYSIFLEEIPERKTNFSTALAEHDLQKLVGLAHSLKGVSLTIGSNMCHDIALALEKAAKEGDREEAGRLYTELESLLDTLHNRLVEMGY